MALSAAHAVASHQTTPRSAPPKDLQVWVAATRGRLMAYRDNFPVADQYYDTLLQRLSPSHHAVFLAGTQNFTWNRRARTLRSLWPPASFPPTDADTSASGSRYTSPSETDEVSHAASPGGSVPLTPTTEELGDDEGEEEADPSSDLAPPSPPPPRTVGGRKRQTKGKTAAPKPPKAPRLSIKVPPRRTGTAAASDLKKNLADRPNRNRRGPIAYLNHPPCAFCTYKGYRCAGDGTRRHVCEPCMIARKKCSVRDEPPASRKSLPARPPIDLPFTCLIHRTHRVCGPAIR